MYATDCDKTTATPVPCGGAGAYEAHSPHPKSDQDNVRIIELLDSACTGKQVTAHVLDSLRQEGKRYKGHVRNRIP